MKRRTFLQITAGCLVGVGTAFRSGALDAAPVPAEVALGWNEHGQDCGYRCLFLGLGEEGVSACRGFFDYTWPSEYPGEVGVRNQEGLSDALAGVDGGTGCVFILSADDTGAIELALVMARATQGRGALFRVAVLLPPPELPWRQLAVESAVRQLRTVTTAVVLLPASAEPGMAPASPDDPLVLTLGLFAMEPSLIDCDIQDIRQVMGTGGLWLARSAPFAGIEQGDDSGTAVDRCLADVPVNQPSALIAKWRARPQDISLANYDAIVAACGHRLAPGGDSVVTTGLVLDTGDRAAQLLVLARVA